MSVGCGEEEDEGEEGSKPLQNPPLHVLNAHYRQISLFDTLG